MAKILIVDDDRDFNTLLRDIFEQSGYEVTSVLDPLEGFERYRKERFDVVVSDQKMPGLTGDAMIRKMKAVRNDVPIIMVSGYLDNETIRSLIREGVGGIFLKPLNVFSLIKRTAALIEQQQHRQSRRRAEQGGEPEPFLDYDHGLPFPFRTFPCKASGSLDFAKRLYDLRGFKSNLLVVGGKGTDLAAITRDLTGFPTDERDYFCQLNATQLDAATFQQSLADARQQHATRFTAIVAYPNTLTAPQRQLLYAATRAEGPFREVEIPVRYVFFLTDEIDALYDRGELSDDLYMFLGTLEVRVPDLRDLRDDLPIMMLRFLGEEATQRHLQPVRELESRARIFIRDREWRGNSLEMRSFCRELAGLEKPILTREDLEAVERALNLGKASFGGFDLRSELRQGRQDYCQAVLKLCNGSFERAARVLGTEEGFLHSILPPA